MRSDVLASLATMLFSHAGVTWAQQPVVEALKPTREQLTAAVFTAKCQQEGVFRELTAMFDDDPELEGLLKEDSEKYVCGCTGFFVAKNSKVAAMIVGKQDYESLQAADKKMVMGTFAASVFKCLTFKLEKDMASMQAGETAYPKN